MKKLLELDDQSGKNLYFYWVFSPHSISNPEIAPTTPLPFVPDLGASDTCFPKECGNPVMMNPEFRADSSIKKIVGGQETGAIKYWPWQSSLRRSFIDDPSLGFTRKTQGKFHLQTPLVIFINYSFNFLAFYAYF